MPHSFAVQLVDVGALASLYSQVAGVLAGFAFTSLTIFLARERDEPDPTGLKRAVSIALFAALTSLIIVAVLYTVLAGAAQKVGPALTGTLVYGVPLGLSVLALFHAVTLQALQYRFLDGMAWTARLIVVVVGPTIVMALLAGAVVDVFRLRCQDGEACDASTQLEFGKPLGLGLTFTAVLLVLSVLALPLFPRIIRARLWMRPVPTYLVLGVAISSIGEAIVLTSAPPDWQPSDRLVGSILTVAFVLLLVFALSSVLALQAIKQPDDDPITTPMPAALQSSAAADTTGHSAVPAE